MRRYDRHHIAPMLISLQNKSNMILWMTDKLGRNVMNIWILRNFTKTNFQVKRTFPSNDRNALTGTSEE